MNQSSRWRFANDESSLGLATFLPALLEENNVREVVIRRLKRGPSLQGRVTDERVLHLAEVARDRSETSDAPFWESMMILASNEPPDVRREIFREALYHRAEIDGLDERSMALSEFTSILRGVGFRESDERGITAITSLVRTSGADRHIPLLDFRASPSASNAQLITELLTTLGVRGYLVDSGRSYHFYGAETVAAERYWAFLGRAQLMAPFIDERWIAHQLISAKAALRVSTNAERHATPPRLVAWSSDLHPHLQ
jgi:hypothetical protein